MPPKAAPRVQTTAHTGCYNAVGVEDRRAPKKGNGYRCAICSQLGLGGDDHPTEWCWTDPKSKVYKPAVRRRKVARARAMGIPIPPELDIEDEEADGDNIVSKVEKLVACMLDNEHERQQMVDEYLETRQHDEGKYEVLGSITHLGDGEVP